MKISFEKLNTFLAYKKKDCEHGIELLEMGKYASCMLAYPLLLKIVFILLA